MIVQGIKLRPGYTSGDLRNAVQKKLRGSGEPIRSVELLKRSIDARKKPDVFYVLSVLVNEPHPLKTPSAVPEAFPAEWTDKFRENFRTAVVGSGPAGLFAAVRLLRAGIPVTLYERGEPIEERTKTVERFFETGKLDQESNVQFGEGGAGAFSDGKLNTGTHGERNQEVLRLFYEFGAPEDVLYDQKPHLGTDVLHVIVKRIREEILRLGGGIRYKALVSDLRSEADGVSFTVNGREEVKARFLVLSVGHSARDTFEMLYRNGFSLEQKAFAAGVRIEHLQSDISEAQYGAAASSLPAASYKLVGKGAEGRGVYSFCMCPGGYVVNSSSEPGGTVVNGMSYRNRDGKNANSAIVVQVGPKDFPGDDPLAGVRFQRALEEKAYQAASGRIPVQRFGDFLSGTRTTSFGRILPEMKGAFAFADLNEVLPPVISGSLKIAIPAFSRSILGFDDPDALLSGVETRTSSPVRILRNESMEAERHPGIYPAGEGAGYAGGIVSSAADGLKAADAVIRKVREDTGRTTE